MNLIKKYEYLNIDEVCRICLIKKNEMEVLSKSGIENMIISGTSIKILEEEKTHFICIDCVNKIHGWFKCYQQITESFKIGHLIIQEHKKRAGFVNGDFHNNTIIITDEAKNNLNIFPKDLTKFGCDNEKDVYDKKCEYATLNINLSKNNQYQKGIDTNLETLESFQNKNYECDKCGKLFKQVQTLNDHMKRHYNLKNFACSLCGKTFYKQFNVLEHMRIHTGERPFRCEFCVKTFTRSLRLRNHIKKIHFNDNRFPCSFCNKLFVDNYQLKIHMRIHTGEKPYKCLNCGKAFALQGQLNSHVKYKHTKQKDFICNICGREFTAKQSLEAHLQVHYGKQREPKHGCSTCGKKCISTTQLKIHVKSQHTGERPFPCQICDRSFITKSGLESHSRSHTGEKSYSCGECGKSFGTNSTLKIHVRLHTGERPYKCAHCFKTFTQSSTLNTHRKIHK